ncbi:MAG: hypothetical protein CMP11_00590 [Zetaproteobacteria bacterium]|nr:hypothetical protein [Pseudobdellovibrionaceae bacterium]
MELDQHLVRDISRFLDSIELGNVTTNDAFHLADSFDDLITYFLLRYLREKYPAKAGSVGASERLISLLTHNGGQIAKKALPPKGEVIFVEWFDENYEMKSFFKNRNDFVTLILDKLEG